jgi:hypothetical protein
MVQITHPQAAAAHPTFQFIFGEPLGAHLAAAQIDAHYAVVIPVNLAHGRLTIPLPICRTQPPAMTGYSRMWSPSWMCAPLPAPCR